jgi:hypothetical protein
MKFPVGHTMKVYVDGVDYEEDAWEYPTQIYPELIDFKKYGKNCIRECGVYRVEMKVVEVLNGDQVKSALKEIGCA